MKLYIPDINYKDVCDETLLFNIWCRQAIVPKGTNTIRLVLILAVGVS